MADVADHGAGSAAGSAVVGAAESAAGEVHPDELAVVAQRARLAELREVALVAVNGSFDHEDLDALGSDGAPDTDALLEELTGAVGGLGALLAGESPAAQQLSPGQLHRLVCGLVAATDRLQAQSATVGEVWRARGAWAADRSRTAAGRLARDTHRCTRDAKRLLHRGRALASMPATSRAFLAGRIGTGAADLLIRTRERAEKRADGAVLFGRDEEMLVGFCATLTYDDAARALDYWLAYLDADADEAEHQRRRDQRRFAAVATLDQMTHVEGELDPLTAAMFTSELKRLTMEMLKNDRATGSERTAAQRRADALAMMALRSRQLGNGDESSGSKRPAPLISVVMGHESFARMCELADGTRLAPGLLVPLLSEAQIESLIYDGKHRLIGATRKRTFTGALRRAIEVRDRRCTHPSGCDIEAEWSDIDHIIPHSERGPTAFENGRVRCATHNRHPEHQPPGPSP